MQVRLWDLAEDSSEEGDGAEAAANGGGCNADVAADAQVGKDQLGPHLTCCRPVGCARSNP